MHGKSPNRARLVRYGAEPADPGHHYRSRRSGAWERERLVEEVQPEQILSLHPEFNAPIAEHDRRLPPLTEACLRLQEALLESRALREAFDRVASATPPDKKLAEYLGGLDPQDHLKFIAEDIINSVRKLPSYYITAPIWNQHRDEFVASLETLEVSPFWQATVAAIAGFSTSVHELMGKLKAFRNDLSISAGVPIVDRLTRQI